MKSLFHVIPTVFFSFLISIVSYAQIDTLCYGSVLESYSITPNEGSSYTWAVSGGGIILGSSIGTSIQVDWSNAPVGLINNAITLTEQLNGCTAEQLLSVEILPNPTPNLSVSSPSICIGDSVVLSADSGYDTYNWSPNSIVGASYVFTPTSFSDNEFVLEVIGEGNCSTQENIQIEIFELPIVEITLSDSIICLGESISVSATPGLASYVWTNSSVSNQQTTFIPTVSDTDYSVNVTDLNGCISSDNASLTINEINPIDLLVNGANTTTICFGESIFLEVTQGLFSYEWNPAVVSDEGGVYTPTNQTETTYSVISTDSDGCQSVDEVNITINNLPNPGPIIFN